MGQSHIPVEVVDIRRVSGDGKLKAFASVKFDNSLIIRHFSILDKPEGLSIKLPQKLNKNGVWEAIISVDDFLLADIEDAIFEAYDRDINID